MTGTAALLYEASTWVVPVVIAVTVHEVAHGLVAYRFGDPTAQQAGRLSLNPLKHIDRFGTILLPALLILTTGGRFIFGYAKPVPVDFRRLRHPRRDMVLVAVAGPATNVLLAVASALLFYGADLAPDPTGPWLALNLEHSVVINVVLCCFNMLPLPPLDGGRVAVGILPRPLALPLARLERFGLLILLLLIFVLPWLGQKAGLDLNILGWLVGVPADALYNFVLTITGHG